MLCYASDLDVFLVLNKTYFFDCKCLFFFCIFFSFGCDFFSFGCDFIFFAIQNKEGGVAT